MRILHLSMLAISIHLASCSDSHVQSNKNLMSLKPVSFYSNTNLVPTSKPTPSSLSAGLKNTCSLIDEKIQCWGSNTYGVNDVPALNHPTQITVGKEHACALTSEGVKCWGNNDDGQTKVPPLNQPSQISAGALHTCALTLDGIKCWGNNKYGQIEIPILSNPTQISSGFYHVCALADDGVKCWGINDWGQTVVPVLIGPTNITAGGYYSCAHTEDGVRCWGSEGSIKTPVLKNPTQVAVGGVHACALTDEGVKCWGLNQNLQTETLSTLKQAEFIAAGGFHSCALTGKGVRCWGMNDTEQSIPPIVNSPWLDVTSDANQKPSNCTESPSNCTFYDRFSNLEWSNVSTPELSWDESLRYCDTLNHNNNSHWRMPKATELVEAYAHKIYNVPKDHFIENYNQLFWSSTPCTSTGDLANVINLTDGSTGRCYYKGAKIAVTCVREP
jgi:Protein of unknown function (DUF1566)/Regulator of chromosome condensation (RCC1) repeat